MEIENQPKFYCEQCNFKCDFQVFYDRHLKTNKHINGKITRVHTKPRVKKDPIIYTCEKCDFTSTHLYNYKTHILNNHSSNEDKKKEFPYYCECCNIGIFAESVFNKHLLSKKHVMKSK
jgi:hypothetical protein